MALTNYDIIHGIGYRIGATDRTLGAVTNNPVGFIVVNLTNNKIFVVTGGVWVSGGTFPNATFSTSMFQTWSYS